MYRKITKSFCIKCLEKILFNIWMLLWQYKIKLPTNRINNKSYTSGYTYKQNQSIINDANYNKIFLYFLETLMN